MTDTASATEDQKFRARARHVRVVSRLRLISDEPIALQLIYHIAPVPSLFRRRRLDHVRLTACQVGSASQRPSFGFLPSLSFRSTPPTGQREAERDSEKGAVCFALLVCLSNTSRKLDGMRPSQGWQRRHQRQWRGEAKPWQPQWRGQVPWQRQWQWQHSSKMGLTRVPGIWPCGHDWWGSWPLEKASKIWLNAERC